MTEISDIIDWYEENSSICPPQDLLDAEDRLSGYTYYLADELYEKRKSFINAEVKRKLTQAKIIIKRKASGLTVSESEAQSVIETQELILTEKLLEAECSGIKIRIEQANRVLDSIRTRISWLKNEANLTKGQV